MGLPHILSFFNNLVNAFCAKRYPCAFLHSLNYLAVGTLLVLIMVMLPANDYSF